MSSLYQITEQLVALDQLLEEIGGDVSEGTQGEALEKWIKEYEWQQREKIDAYGGMIASMKADMEAIQEEVERLNIRSRIINNRIERLKAMAKFAMEMRGIRKLEGVKFTISIQKNGGKPPLELLVEDPEKLPLEFVKIVRQPDKDAIRAALESNDPKAEKIARIGMPGESVRIR